MVKKVAVFGMFSSQENVYENLYKNINNICSLGYKHFVVGCETNFDILAIKVINKLKTIFSDIILEISYNVKRSEVEELFASAFDYRYMTEETQIINLCEKKHVQKIMILESDLCLFCNAYLDQKLSTLISYAMRNNKKVININN